MCGIAAVIGTMGSLNFVDACSAAARRGCHMVGVANLESDCTWSVSKASAAGDFNLRDWLIANWRGGTAIFHARLATVGSAENLDEAQPWAHGRTVLAHNGNFYRYRDHAHAHNLCPQTASDSEVLALDLKKHETPDRLLMLLREVPYAVIGAIGNQVFAARGKHPLFYAASRGCFYLTSYAPPGKWIPLTENELLHFR